MSGLSGESSGLLTFVLPQAENTTHKGYSKKQMEDTIIKLLEKWHRKLEMER